MKLSAKSLFPAVLLAVFACSSGVDAALFEGTWLDTDNNEPNLFINKQEDGSFDVKIGIFRLTSLDDGVGTLSRKGLSFTATDAAGNPISGIITVQKDTATVTFTDSTWPLLENGSAFKYIRQN